MDKTIAIYGGSCTGKTTIGRFVGLTLSSVVRHCGEIAMSEADNLGVRIDELPDSIHTRIDEETQQLVEEGRLYVVEGRYLDIVLAEVPSVFLVRLQCNDSTRARRFARRMVGKKDPNSILEELDLIDSWFRVSHYASRRGREPDFILDTTDLSATQCCDRILAEVT